MNREKIQDILNQTDELSIEELRELLRQIKLKKRAWNEQGKESVMQTEKEKEKLVQSGILRKISLIVQGHQFFLEDGKPSSYEYILVDDETGQIRKKVSPRMEGETSNRAIILGIMDAVQRLSADRRCQVKVYTRGSWVFMAF